MVLDTHSPVAVAEEFFTALYGADARGYLVVSTAPPGMSNDAPLKPAAFKANDIGAVARYAVKQATLGHVWFGCGLQSQPLAPGKRGGSKTVGAIPGVWSDIDIRHPVHKRTDLPETIDDATDLIDKVGLTPTFIIDTGHGVQSYWLFHDVWRFQTPEERDEAQKLLNDFKATVAGYAKERKWDVDAVADLARLMRPPGTINQKDPLDAPAVRVYAFNPDCRYSVDDIRSIIKVPEPAPPLQTATQSQAKTRDEEDGISYLIDDDALLDKARGARNGKTFEALWSGSDAYHGGDTSKADMGLLVRLAFWTGNDAKRMDRMFRRSGRWREKWDKKHFANGETYGEGSIRKAISRTKTVYDPAQYSAETDDEERRDAGAYALVPGQHTTGEFEVIEVGGSDFAAEIIGRIPPDTIFRRGGIPGEIVGGPGQRTFRALSIDDMRLVIDRHMKLGKWLTRGMGESARQEIVFVPCSRDQAGLVLALAANDPRVGEVKVLTTFPVFGPDFRLCPPGYHDGVFYGEPEELKGLTPETSPDEIHRVIDDLLIDFPWKDLSSQQNYVGNRAKSGEAGEGDRAWGRRAGRSIQGSPGPLDRRALERVPCRHASRGVGPGLHLHRREPDEPADQGMWVDVSAGHRGQLVYPLARAGADR